LQHRCALSAAISARADIDNRLKTLFDALSVPNDGKQMPSIPPQDGEDPFYVLLADDRLVTHVAVQTDYLLQSVDDDRPIPDINDARIIVTVNIRSYGPGTNGPTGERNAYLG
jgi:hypothetical protein